MLAHFFFFFFFFNDTATTEIYTLSLHDALPICLRDQTGQAGAQRAGYMVPGAAIDVVDVRLDDRRPDRKSTRLNSSHLVISYAVFCLKKKKKKKRVSQLKRQVYKLTHYARINRH